MSPNQYANVAARLAEAQDVLFSLQQACKPARSPGLMADVVAMQGILARIARNSWAMMDETQQIRTAQRLTKHQPIQ
jgi:hypothetical protein